MYPELDFEDIPPLPGVSALPTSLSGWVAHIREQDMPAFGFTVDAVRGIIADDSASAGRLAAVILRDQAMTTKVLRLANSAYFNAAHQPVSTISRAIVVLGFDVVADMTVGLALIDALLRGGVRRRVTEEMARCFFAATVARGLARMRGEGRAEEVFIAALLARVGEMAFWCFGGERAEVLDARMADVHDDESIKAVQQTVLSFPLRQLTHQLAREWRLGGLLAEALDPAPRPSALVQAIRLGHVMAKAVNAGWDSVNMRSAIAQAAAFTGEEVEVLRERLEHMATEAAQLATGYGASDAARAIPLPAKADPTELHEVEALPEPNRQERQLSILRDLSMRIMSGATFGDIVYLACEGILHGVGFERVIVALSSPNGRQIIGKYALGAQSESLSRRFVFTLGNSPVDAVDEVFATRQPVRGIHPGGRLQGVLGNGPFCMAPILAQGRCVGLVHAERDSSEPIDDESFFGFTHFVQHISMGLQSLRGGAG